MTRYGLLSYAISARLLEMRLHQGAENLFAICGIYRSSWGHTPFRSFLKSSVPTRRTTSWSFQQSRYSFPSYITVSGALSAQLYALVEARPPGRCYWCLLLTNGCLPVGGQVKVQDNDQPGVVIDLSEFPDGMIHVDEGGSPIMLPVYLKSRYEHGMAVLIIVLGL